MRYRCQTVGVDIEGVIEALGGRYDADEAAIIERMLREYGGTIPDEQLIGKIESVCGFVRTVLLDEPTPAVAVAPPRPHWALAPHAIQRQRCRDEYRTVRGLPVPTERATDRALLRR